MKIKWRVLFGVLFTVFTGVACNHSLQNEMLTVTIPEIMETQALEVPEETMSAAVELRKSKAVESKKIPEPEYSEVAEISTDEWLAAYLEILGKQVNQYGVSPAGVDVDGKDGLGLCFGDMKDMNNDGVPEFILVRYEKSDHGNDKVLEIWSYEDGAARQTVYKILDPWIYIDENIGVYRVDDKVEFVHYRRWEGSANPGHYYTLIDIDGNTTTITFIDSKALSFLEGIPDAPTEVHAIYIKDDQKKILTENEFRDMFGSLPLDEFGVSTNQITDFIDEMNLLGQNLRGDSY